MYLDFFTGKEIASSAKTSTIDSYEDEVEEYQKKDYTYIPIPDSKKYYDLSRDELREIEQGQYLHPDTPMLEAFSRLQEYPFLLFDDFRDFRSEDGEYIPAGIKKFNLPDGSFRADEIANNPDDFRERYDDETYIDAVDSLEEMASERYEILTLADANKRRARELFYRVLSEFEVQLAHLIEQEYPDSESLFNEAKPEAIGRWQKSKIDELVVHISEHMYLSTLLKIVGKSENLREKMGYSSRNQFDNDLGGLVKLRNRIMHPTQTLVHDTDDLKKEINRVNRTVEALDNLNAKEIQPKFPKSVDQ
ncbi:hypothetical protein [Halorubrum cibi]|uniref:Uncharacterized protein n=1 Tax=Halorubrum cibi TaxID=413815 RepID=A0A521F3P7_9EURY|nr:hypothetical protein [Halorubrum cibi]SMO90794.1 hypothetical protein SAMN06264867_11811 [Halorubrum cibi]